MPAIPIWRGPQHILVEGDDTWWELVPREALGMPAREVFDTKYYGEILRAVDEAYESGEPRTIFVDGDVQGACTIIPLLDEQGESYGIHG